MSDVPQDNVSTPAASAAVPAQATTAPVVVVKKKRAASEWQKFVGTETKGQKGRGDFKKLSEKYREIKAATKSA